MILASDIIKTILIKSYKGISYILWDSKIYAWAVVVAWGWGWGGEGAHWGILTAAVVACEYGCSLNQIYRTYRCDSKLQLLLY